MRFLDSPLLACALARFGGLKGKSINYGLELESVQNITKTVQNPLKPIKIDVLNASNILIPLLVNCVGITVWHGVIV